jgi:hypothetical protein
MTGRVVRARKPRRPVPTAPTPSTIDEAPPQLRAPNRTDWRGPLDEDERAALEAGWGFIE